MCFFDSDSTDDDDVGSVVDSVSVSRSVHVDERRQVQCCRHDCQTSVAAVDDSDARRRFVETASDQRRDLPRRPDFRAVCRRRQLLGVYTAVHPATGGPLPVADQRAAELTVDERRRPELQRG